MEDIGGSQKERQLAHEFRRANLVLAPKDYFLGPVFAATPQMGSREVTVADRLYLIGGFHPMDSEIYPPALDVRHARAIFSLLSFRDPYEETHLIRFSFNELCRRYAQSNGGRYARAIKKIVRDLMDSYSLDHSVWYVKCLNREMCPPLFAMFWTQTGGMVIYCKTSGVFIAFLRLLGAPASGQFDLDTGPRLQSNWLTRNS